MCMNLLSLSNHNTKKVSNTWCVHVQSVAINVFARLSGPSLRSASTSHSGQDALWRLRSAYLQRVQARFVGGQASTTEPCKWHVDRVCAPLLGRVEGHRHGSNLREPMHHNDMHDNGGSVCHIQDQEAKAAALGKRTWPGIDLGPVATHWHFQCFWKTCFGPWKTMLMQPMQENPWSCRGWAMSLAAWPAYYSRRTRKGRLRKRRWRARSTRLLWEERRGAAGILFWKKGFYKSMNLIETNI